MAPHPQELRSTPFPLVASVIEPRVATKSMLLSIAKYLEHHVAQPSFASVLLATFEHRRHFTRRTRERYRTLGETASFVGVFASGMPLQPVDGVLGADLQPSEPLADEWDVCVVTPHIAAAFVAQDLGDTSVPDGDRRFAYCLTYDRQLALRAAHMLMRRMATADRPA